VVLAVYHSKTPNTKMSPVDLARVDQVSKVKSWTSDFGR
jgi:hypothetical protein